MQSSVQNWGGNTICDICYCHFPLQHQSGLYLDKVAQIYAGDDGSSNPPDPRKPVTEANSLKPLVQSLEYHHYNDLDSVLIGGKFVSLIVCLPNHKMCAAISSSSPALQLLLMLSKLVPVKPVLLQILKHLVTSVLL